MTEYESIAIEAAKVILGATGIKPEHLEVKAKPIVGGYQLRVVVWDQSLSRALAYVHNTRDIGDLHSNRFLKEEVLCGVGNVCIKQWCDGSPGSNKNWTLV